MRDISLLMASLLTTGQTNVPELPEVLPEPPQNTQQELRQNREIEVSVSTEIAPPEFSDSDKTLELTDQECNYSHCQERKQFQASGKLSKVGESSSVLQSPQSVIILEDKKNKPKNIHNKIRNKIQFKDSFSLSQEAEEKEEQENIQKKSPSLSEKTFASESAEVKSQAIPLQQFNLEASGSSSLPHKFCGVYVVRTMITHQN